MTDHIPDILSYMSANGCAPRDGKIIIDDRKHRFTPKDHKKPTGEYCFKHCADGSVIGWFRDYRVGETHKYISKRNREMSAEEKAEFKKRIDAERRARRKRLDQERQAAKAKAARIWEAAKRGETGYIKRKQIDAGGARRWGDLLVVPAYKLGELVTLQIIADDGSKRFMKNGEIDGAYGSVGKDTSVIHICEGFATAKSVYKACGGVAVWAFNAGNLCKVAQTIRGKYPDARIIICADNDQWTTKPSGELYNIGLIEGRKAALAVGGLLAWPDFPFDDEPRRTDYNDMACTDGLECVKQSIASARDLGAGCEFAANESSLPAPSPLLEPPPEWLEQSAPLEYYEEEARAQASLYRSTQIEDANWKDRLAYKDDGKLVAKSMNNVSLFLANAEPFRDMFCYDEFAHEKMVVRCPPWENPAHFRPRPKNNSDTTWIAMSLERKGLTVARDTLNNILDAVVERKRVNPAQEYFSSLSWDGVPRLDKWLPYYAGAEFDPPEYLAAIGRKWLTAAVKRVFEAGCKFDHMLILEGDQGRGKSTLLRRLATIHGREYFDDTIRATDLGLEKTVPKLQGVMIVELAELTGMRKADMDSFKQQITIQEDRIVKKYQNEPTRYPRQFVFAGTVNPMAGYLSDPTGNRRFWPVRVGDIDLDALENDKHQLWAEAYHCYQNGEVLHLNAAGISALEKIQESRKIISPWMPELERMSDGRTFIPSSEIWECLGFEKSRRNSRDSETITKIMTELGFEYDRPMYNGHRQYGWRKR
jgi:putative DNA primase/helicase